jgi:ABC-type nitrate/sulfonate/bicarbonate transport system substrate-binding protein
VPSERAISSSIVTAILVVLIIVAAVGGVFAGSSLSTSGSATSTVTQTSTKTSTQTVQVSGSSTVVPTTVTVTSSASASSSCTTPSTLTPISIATPSPAGSNVLVFVANAKGFFAQQGLQANFQVLATANVLINGLLTGQINFGMVGEAGVIPLYLQGQNLTAVAPAITGVSTGGIAVSAALYKSGAVTTIKQLSGHRVGTIAPPSNAYYIAQFLGKYYNVNWTLVTFPSVVTLVNSFNSGQIDGIAGQPLATFGQAGIPYQLLLNPADVSAQDWANILRSQGYAVPQGVAPETLFALASPAMIKQHPDIVQKYVNALTEAGVWINTHNWTQVLNAAYSVPSTLTMINKTSVAYDMPYVVANTPKDFNMTVPNWTGTVYYALALNPAIQGVNQTLLLKNTYQSLVNNTFYQHSSWCYDPAVWAKDYP